MQMSGRAGRAGIDEYGESFLMLSKRDLESVKGVKLVQAPLEEITSMMSQDGIHRITLELICSGLVKDV